MPAPPPQGLYTGRHEHDSCGVAFVATLSGEPSREIVDHAFTALQNLRHRGASGSEPDSGDGAGILVQIPDAFLRAAVDFELPPAGSYAAGLVFLPDDDGPTVARIGELATEERLAVLGWRNVPVHAGIVGTTARRVMPHIRQVFVRGSAGETGLDLDRRTYRLRKRAERETGAYFPSLSARTLVYKGMLTPDQLQPFFVDLSDPRFASALALVHSRFSTNTFPSWPLAHPYRFIAHNGEINTVMGNRNWMRAREAALATAHIPGRLADLFPVLTPGASDSASFDEALELLTLGGYELPHAVLMMIPEAWENDARMDPARRAFYAYHAGLMEAWDGPASITFTDGSLVGAVLDRNGLRPGRFWVTDDGLVVLASEAGVLDIEPARVVRNDEFTDVLNLDTSDEWIRTRTGIRERRFAGLGETSASLGTIAARNAVEASGLTPHDIDLIEATLRRCVEAAQATLLHIHLHHFQPNGVSGVVVLAESHISIHTWPDLGYAALDVFMCGKASPDACIPVLREAFKAKRVEVNEILRGQAA